VFAAHRGEEIDTQGDSYFVAFRSASDALSVAAAFGLAALLTSTRSGSIGFGAGFARIR
jgi:class 3 adenylate cyclase